MQNLFCAFGEMSVLYKESQNHIKEAFVSQSHEQAVLPVSAHLNAIQHFKSIILSYKYVDFKCSVTDVLLFGAETEISDFLQHKSNSV